MVAQAFVIVSAILLLLAAIGRPTSPPNNVGIGAGWGVNLGWLGLFFFVLSVAWNTIH